MPLTIMSCHQLLRACDAMCAGSSRSALMCVDVKRSHAIAGFLLVQVAQLMWMVDEGMLTSCSNLLPPSLFSHTHVTSSNLVCRWHS